MKNKSKAKKPLRQNEQNLHLIMDNVPTLIAHFDVDQHHKYSNSAYQKFVGLSGEEIQKQSLRKVLGEPAYQKIKPWVKQALSGQKVEFESTLSFKDRIHYMKMSYIPDMKNEMVDGFIAFVIDNTEQKKTEMALKKSQTKLGIIQKTSSMGIITINTEGIIDSCNLKIQELFGYTLTEMIGQNINMLIPQSHQEKHDEYFANYFKTGYSDAIGRGIEGQRKDGSIVQIYITIDKVQFENDLLFTGYVFDITEQKQVEEQLRLFKQTLEHMGEGVSLVRARDLTFIYTNPFYDKMFGYGRGELIDKEVSRVNAPLEDKTPEEVSSEIVAILEKNGAWKGEVYNLKKDGASFWTYAKVSVFEHLVHGKIWISVQGDITEKKRIKRELIEAKEQAEAANRAKTQFLANMSHEIRTSLGTITGFTQILKFQAKKLNFPESILKPLENIHIAGNNLSEIVNNILDLAKIEAGKIEVCQNNVNLRQLIQNIYSVNKVLAEEKNIHLFYNLNIGLFEVIISDQTLLTQILMNLVGNAIKFTPERKKIEIEVFIRKKHPQILFQVIDQGIGIAENKLETIFNTFEQVDNNITRQYEGTGLGLAIVKKIVELLNGTIEVDSTLNEGSVFSVAIPLMKPTIPVLNLNEDIDMKNYAFLKEKRILLIEDNPLYQEMVIALFKQLELPLDLAGNGKEGIEKILELKPDLVLMDIHMPVMDGIEVIRQIRLHQKYKDLPIIALSADAFVHQQRKAFSVGFNDYLTKPIDFALLLLILKKHLC